MTKRMCFRSLKHHSDWLKISLVISRELIGWNHSDCAPSNIRQLRRSGIDLDRHGGGWEGICRGGGVVGGREGGGGRCGEMWGCGEMRGVGGRCGGGAG